MLASPLLRARILDLFLDRGALWLLIGAGTTQGVVPGARGYLELRGGRRAPIRIARCTRNSSRARTPIAPELLSGTVVLETAVAP